MAENYIYKNPVKRGFFPDPSVVRVGEDYYLVNSSFEYFPALPISHSKDLINWKIIGHVVTNSDFIDLTNIDDSHGFWAPDISFHNGTFYIFATLRLNGKYDSESGKLVHRQMMVKSDKPEGPYSKPYFVDHRGIDPSHFIDDDGKHYMILSGGAQAIPLDNKCTKAIGTAKLVWSGTGARCPEGPHILKKDGFYYAILAEGGTGYGHRISVARSTQLFGSYEESPYNPVLTQTNPDALIQRTGHGKLVNTKDGKWWCLYLCGRSNNGQFTTLGRETSLDPVEWTDDGWFTINNGNGPSLENTVLDLPWTPVPDTSFDDFDSIHLPLHWHWARNPNPDLWSLSEKPGYVQLISSNNKLGSIHIGNLLCRREEELTYTAIVKMDFNPVYNGHEAGIVNYWGIYSWIKCVFTLTDRKTIKLTRCVDGEITEVNEIDASEGEILLKVEVKGQRREYFSAKAVSHDKIDTAHWESVGIIENASFLAGESITKGKAHTGTMLGLYASSGGACDSVSAYFDWVKFENHTN